MAIEGAQIQVSSWRQWVPYRTGLQPSAKNFRSTIEKVF
jgi:hypothetical protein